MRIALISDIHGNSVALNAVMADIAANNVDRVVCLGDVATLGPDPRGVIQILRDHGCPCILGNHDAFMLDEGLIHTYTEAPIVVEAVDWCREQLEASDFEFLEGFVDGMMIDLGDGQTLQLFHGTPNSHMVDVLCTTEPDRLDEMLDGNRATVMAGGHTHIQMLRQHKGILLVNPGSVGQPFVKYVHGTEPELMGHAEYAIIEGSNGTVNVNLRRVCVDGEAARAAVAGCDNPLGPMLLGQYDQG
jgi:putative phosphoesterase